VSGDLDVIQEWVLRTTSWILLGGWLGSWGLFAFEVAPTTFQVLYTQGTAGEVVAPVLATLHNYGIVAGLGLAGVAALGRRGWLRIVWPLALAALCAISEYGITPAINEVQPHSFGPALEQEAAARFSQLHQLSRSVFGFVGLGVLGLVVLEARPGASAAPPSDS
jgi:hypothetical protein